MDSGRESALSTFTCGSESPTKHFGLNSAKSFASSSDDKNKEERRSDLILVSLVLLQQELERQFERLNSKNAEKEDRRPFLDEIDENCRKTEETLKSCGRFIAELVEALGDVGETLLKISNLFISRLSDEIGLAVSISPDGGSYKDRSEGKKVKFADETHVKVAETAERLAFVANISAQVRQAAVEAQAMMEKTKESIADVQINIENEPVKEAMEMEATSSTPTVDSDAMAASAFKAAAQRKEEEEEEEEKKREVGGEEEEEEDAEMVVDEEEKDKSVERLKTDGNVDEVVETKDSNGDASAKKKKEQEEERPQSKEEVKKVEESTKDTSSDSPAKTDRIADVEQTQREERFDQKPTEKAAAKPPEVEEDENLEQIIYTTEPTTDEMAEQIWTPLHFPLDFLPDDVMAGQGVTLKVPPNTLKESDLECRILGLDECQVPIQEGDELLTYVFQLSTRNGCEVRFKPEPCQLILPHVPLARVSGKEPVVKMCRIVKGRLQGNWRELRSTIIQPEKLPEMEPEEEEAEETEAEGEVPVEEVKGEEDEESEEEEEEEDYYAKLEAEKKAAEEAAKKEAEEKAKAERIEEGEEEEINDMATNMVETSLSSLTTVVLAVISRFRRDRMVVKHEGTVMQSSTDPRVKIQLQKGCVRISNNIAIQTRPTDSEDLMDILRLRQVEMDFLSIMSPILDFASVGRIAQPLTIQVPCKAPSRPVVPGADKKPGTGSAGGGGDGGGGAGGAGSGSAANSDDEAPPPPPKPKSAASQINNLGRIWDDDSDLYHLPDTFVLLARNVNEENWSIREAAEFPPSKRSDLVKVNYQPEKLHEKLILMRIKATVKEGQPEELAQQMELAINERRVGLYLFQKRADPTQVVAELVTKAESDKIEDRLGKQGFEKIAMLANDLPVIKEGQQVEIKFRNNIKCCGPKVDSNLVIPFFANMRSRLFFTVSEVEKFQDNYKTRYQGFVQFWMDRPKQKVNSEENLNQGDAWADLTSGGLGQNAITPAKSNCSLDSLASNQSGAEGTEFVCFAELLISLPKPEPVYNSNVDRAPMKLTSMDILFMDDIVPFIKKNFKTYWDILARTLGLSEAKISEIYAQWLTSGGDDQEAIQLVVLNWLKRTSKSQNRLQTLTRYLSDLEQWHIVDYIKKKEKEIKQEKADIVRQEKLDRATQCVSRSYTLQQRWKELARHLNLSKQIILKLSSISDPTDRCYGVMINWRHNAGGPSARIEEVIRALRRMGVNPVADKLARGNF